MISRMFLYYPKYHDVLYKFKFPQLQAAFTPQSSIVLNLISFISNILLLRLKSYFLFLLQNWQIGSKIQQMLIIDRPNLLK